MYLPSCALFQAITQEAQQYFHIKVQKWLQLTRSATSLNPAKQEGEKTNWCPWFTILFVVAFSLIRWVNVLNIFCKIGIVCNEGKSRLLESNHMWTQCIITLKIIRGRVWNWGRKKSKQHTQIFHLTEECKTKVWMDFSVQVCKTVPLLQWGWPWSSSLT